MYKPDNSLPHVMETLFRLLAKAICSFIRTGLFATLLADFKDLIQNRDRARALWTELHIAHAPLFFYLDI